MDATCRFDSITTSLDSIDRAAYALSEIFTLDIRLGDGERDFLCTIHPRRQDANAEELKHLLRREVNDQALRARIGAETAAVRNLVLAVAFSRTGLVGEASPQQ